MERAIKVWTVWSSAVLIFWALIGCVSDRAYRPHVYAASPGACAISPLGDPKLTTPEIGDFELHYLEFDDQGWPFPADGAEPGTAPQVDCALASLRAHLENKSKTGVLAIVFVHGWKHSAKEDDPNLDLFREELQAQVKMHDGTRKVVGFYVAWQGRTVSAPGLRELTFWGRKNSAEHVAEGEVRRFFAGMKALRSTYNAQSEERPNCGVKWGSDEGDCRLRTVMIGHSFGGLILYESVSPYLLEELIERQELAGDPSQIAKLRAQGVADLVLLLNPAFPATRYEVMHRAGQRAVARSADEPPLLVSVTSETDTATGFWFPVGRGITTMFQRSETSPLQHRSISRTPGHVDDFITHELVRKEGVEISVDKRACFRKPAPEGKARRDEYFRLQLDPKHAGEPRVYCGGIELKQRASSKPLVWNVRASQAIVEDHSKIDSIPLSDFVRQLYLDY